jgi:uncharacterized protein (DUF2225 family)
VGSACAAGYYATVAQEYRRIASNVEDSEVEKRRQKERERERENNERKKEWREEMVPDADALW